MPDDFVTSSMFVVVAVVLMVGMMLLVAVACRRRVEAESFVAGEAVVADEVVVYTGTSRHHGSIEVREAAGVSPLHGRRRLYLNGFLQRSGGAKHSEDMVHEAVMRLISTHAVELLRGSPEDTVDVPLRKVVIIGGGDGGALREVLKYPTVEKVLVFELDERVLVASEAHLGASRADDDARVRWVFGDAVDTVRKTLLDPMQELETFDLVVVDAGFGGPNSTGQQMRVDKGAFIEDLRLLLRRDRGDSILVVGVADVPGALQACADLLLHFFAHTWVYDREGSTFCLASRTNLETAPTSVHRAAWIAQDVQTRHWKPAEE